MITVVVVALVTAFPISAASADTSPYCGIEWGSLAKQVSAQNPSSDTLTNVRAGQHPCYDRLVLDGVSWARVGYVDNVYSDGEGSLVPLRGGAKLDIATGRSDDLQTGEPTYRPANRSELVDVTGWRTFRQMAFAGEFEGQTTLGLGVRARLPFRVFVLTSPGLAPRVVIDVAHEW